VALNELDTDAHVFLAMARAFWADNKPLKAIEWVRRSLSVNKDNGDAWALLYKFTSDHHKDGGALKGILDEFLQADPRHGEQWCKVAKAVENSRLSSVEVLKKVAQAFK